MLKPSSSAAVGRQGAPPEPIDLEELRSEAESLDGDRTVVSRAWLKRVHEELSVLHELRIGIQRVFGGQRIQ